MIENASSMKGALKQYTDPSLIEQENGAWERTIGENFPALNVHKIREFLSPDLKSLPLYLYETVRSTNDTAKQLLLEKAPGTAVVLALHQSHGKGRRGRVFVSPANAGIYMSFLLKPACDMRQSVLITTAASVAVVRAIKLVCNQKADIKWVNDIYIDEKKVCGILTEGVTNIKSGKVEHVILGIGINCSTEGLPGELLDVAGAVPGVFSKSRLAAEVINQVLLLMENLESRAFIQEYKRHSLVLGKTITVHTCISGLPVADSVTGLPVSDSVTVLPTSDSAKQETGRTARVLDIDENGGLVVLYSSGERETLSTGEISIRL